MTDARVTTVQNILTHPGTERPWAGRTVSIRLNVPSFIDGGSVEKVGTSYATTDADGLWSVVLEVNDDIDPAGTYYSVREVNSGPLWTFIVPYSATPVTLRSCLVVDPANPDPLVAGVPMPVNQTPGHVATVAADGNSVEWDAGGGGGGAVSSVFGRAGAVVAQSGDYSSFYDAAGAASSAQTAAIAAAASDATTKANAARDAAEAASDPVGSAATVQGHLDTEATTRASADTNLTTAINNEIARATGVEAVKADLVAGKVPSSQLPALVTNNVYTVVSQAAMLALAANVGDMAVRTDLTPHETFILSTLPAATLGNWVQITTPGAVVSVNTQVGAVVLGPTDVGADAAGAAATAQAFAIQRANHTGTQTLATISDAGTAASHPASDFSGSAAGTAGKPLAATDASTTNSRAPSGAAGGVLAGTYPNPSLSTTAAGTTQAALDNSTKIATTAYTDAAVLVEKTRALAAEATIAAGSNLYLAANYR